jgi:hypothetical protein
MLDPYNILKVAQQVSDFTETEQQVRFAARILKFCRTERFWQLVSFPKDPSFL